MFSGTEIGIAAIQQSCMYRFPYILLVSRMKNRAIELERVQTLDESLFFPISTPLSMLLGLYGEDRSRLFRKFLQGFFRVGTDSLDKAIALPAIHLQIHGHEDKLSSSMPHPWKPQGRPKRKAFQHEKCSNSQNQKTNQTLMQFSMSIYVPANRKPKTRVPS